MTIAMQAARSGAIFLADLSASVDDVAAVNSAKASSNALALSGVTLSLEAL